jgi:ribosomal protein S18 acetylase RimI-like enzyme
MKNIKLNIENLTSLWKTVGSPYNGFQNFTNHQQSIIGNSEWPNRVWLHSIFKRKDIPLLKIDIASIDQQITVPVWNNTLFEEFESAGFTLKFQQIGMSLSLRESFKTEQNIELKKVSTKETADKWSETFKDSFGYCINFETLLKSIDKVNYYIAIHKKEVIGTVLTFKTGNNMGVHSVGVPKNHRRKGFAKSIMEAIINIGIETGTDSLILQASDMGKNLYLKLGFQEDFSIRNYILDKN